MTGARLPHSDIPGSQPGCRLPEAYRRLPRPSSAPDAKASTVCPHQLTDPRQNSDDARTHYAVHKKQPTTTPPDKHTPPGGRGPGQEHTPHHPTHAHHTAGEQRGAAPGARSLRTQQCAQPTNHRTPEVPHPTREHTAHETGSTDRVNDPAG